jgi:glycosyltransferase involved in cell wall biosynthesis
MLKIFFSVNHSGCSWWRARQPARMIEKLGLAEVSIFNQYTFGREEVGGTIEWSDFIVSQSPCGVDAVALIMQYQRMGKVVVADYDDLVYSCSPFNPAYKTLGLRDVKIKDVNGVEHNLWKDGERGFSIKDNYCRYRSQRDLIKVVDGLSITNEYLREMYLKENPGIEEKIGIYPNSIDFDLIKPFPKKDTGQIRIGWIASASHLSELWLVRRILDRLFSKYGNRIKFVLQGDVRELCGAFTSEQMEYHPFIDLSVYPVKIASLNLDIGISPLVDDEFNRCKSALKWSEYSALGLPSVVSDLPPYIPVEDGKTGLKAKTEDEWVEKLSLLIENSKLREELAKNAYDENYEKYNLKKNVVNLVKWYEKVYTGSIK